MSLEGPKLSDAELDAIAKCEPQLWAFDMDYGMDGGRYSDNRNQMEEEARSYAERFGLQSVPEVYGLVPKENVDLLLAEILRLRSDCQKLQAFKEYTHKRLDEAGIPTHPDGPHSKEGCRLGDRLDIALRSAPVPSRYVPDVASARHDIQRLFSACGDGSGKLDASWVIVVATKALEALNDGIREDAVPTDGRRQSRVGL